MVIYFSKINLISSEIFEVYEDIDALKNILSVVFEVLEDGEKYIRTDSHRDGNQIITNNIEYSLKILHIHDNDAIEGYLYKKSKIFYNEKDEGNGELRRKSVPNTEAIRFYFDVYEETIGFYTTQRFGYQDFNDAFISILNRCLEKNGRSYRFNIQLRTEGLTVDNLKSELKKIDGITKIKFRFQPPNPGEEILEKIENAGNSIVEEMVKSNATGVSYVFDSKSASGLNLESDLLKDNFAKIEGLNQISGSEKAFSRGYISVEATGKDGTFYTTAEHKAAKTLIENTEAFVDACRKKIKALL